MRQKAHTLGGDLTNYTDCCVQIHDGNFALVDENVSILVVVIASKSNFSHRFVLSTKISEL